MRALIVLLITLALAACSDSPVAPTRPQKPLIYPRHYPEIPSNLNECFSGYAIAYNGDTVCVGNRFHVAP